MDTSFPPTSIGTTRHKVEPLTKKNKNGEPYVRHKDVDEEIAACLAREPPDWDMDSLQSETIVFLIRNLWKRQARASAGRLTHELVKRISRIAKDWSRGFDPVSTDEIIQFTGYEIVDLIFATSTTRQSEYLEMVFRDAVQKRTLRVVNRTRTRLKKVRSESQLQKQPSDERHDGLLAEATGRERRPDEISHDAEELASRPDVIRQSLDAITDQRHREAIVLHYLNGWPIESKDGSPSLASKFNMSGRQIQNWLDTAKKQMRSVWEHINE